MLKIMCIWKALNMCTYFRRFTVDIVSLNEIIVLTSEQQLTMFHFGKRKSVPMYSK